MFLDKKLIGAEMSEITPMVIHLYGEDDELKKTFSRSFVPWKVLKMAVRLAPVLEGGTIDAEAVDALAGLVVEVFGNQFSVEELSDGADLSEMMTVLQTITAKARGGLAGNPTKPG
jgi:hypothetical protein